jgi:tetratricopeptide (TPR) repeat protein
MKTFVRKSGLTACFLLAILIGLTGCSGDPKVRRQKFLDNGNKLFAKGEYKQAALYFRRAIREDAQFAEAYYRVGLTSVKMGNWADAIGSLQRAFTLDPKNSDAGAKLAEIYMIASTQDPKRAKQFAMEIKDVSDRLLQRDPKSFDGLRLAAFLDLNEGKVEEAIAKYRSANATKPDQPEVTVPLVDALVKNKQVPEAEKLALAQIERKKDFLPFYDLLYSIYIRDKRIDEAEKIIRRKIANTGAPEYNLQLAAHYFVQQNRTAMEAAIREVSGNAKVNQSYARTGDFYFSLRENAKARQEYEIGLKSGKDREIYQKRLVQLNVAENKIAEASAITEDMLKANPKDPEAKAMRSALQVSSGDINEINKAITDLTALVRQNGDNPVMHYELARALMAKASKENNKSDLIEQARSELEETIKLRPDFNLARLLLAQVHINRGDFSKSVQVSDEILNLQPASIQALLMRAVAWRGLHEYDKAQATFEGLLRANPNLGDARFHLGQNFLEQGKLAQSEEVFGQMRKLNEGDARWMSGLVQTYVAQRRFKDAMDMLTVQAAKYPENDGVKISLAAVAIVDKQFGKAEEIYTKLLEKNPKSGDYHAMLGQMYETRWQANKEAGDGDLRKAIELYRKAVGLTPENPGLLVKLGQALEIIDQMPEARVYYEKVLRLEPGNVIALNNVAYFKAEEGSDLDGALTMAQKAKQQAPNSPEVADTLGWIYIKKNLPDEALRIFQDLVKKSPENAIFRMHLAQAMFQKGDRAGARTELNKALQSKPSKVTEQQIRTLLQKI